MKNYFTLIIIPGGGFGGQPKLLLGEVGIDEVATGAGGDGREERGGSWAPGRPSGNVGWPSGFLRRRAGGARLDTGVAYAVAGVQRAGQG